MASTLGNAIAFLQDFGLFDVILPFLLVFTIVFAVLEKTKIFGVEKDQTRKNLNSMVAFSIAFFVTASVKIVSAFQVALPQISLILVILISFMLLAGVFFKDEQLDFFGKFTKTTGIIMGVIALVILFIFLAAFGYTDYLFAFFQGDNSTLVTSIILLLLVVAAIWFIIGKKSESSGSGKK